MNCIQECPSLNIFAKDGCKCVEEANQSNMRGGEMTTTIERGAAEPRMADDSAPWVHGYAPDDSVALEVRTGIKRAIDDAVNCHKYVRPGGYCTCGVLVTTKFGGYQAAWRGHLASEISVAVIGALSGVRVTRGDSDAAKHNKGDK